MTLFRPQVKKSEELIAAIRKSGTHTLNPDSRMNIRSVVLQTNHTVTKSDPVRYKKHPIMGILTLKLRPMTLVLIIMALIALTGGTVIAADAAKPGDSLFGIDRAVERVQLNLSLSDVARARTQAEIAEERLRELQELQSGEDTDEEDIDTAENEADTALNQAQDTLDDVIENMESKDNEQAQERLEQVRQKLEDLDQERDTSPHTNTEEPTETNTENDPSSFHSNVNAHQENSNSR